MVLLDDFTTISRLWVNLDDLPIFNDNSFITRAVSYQPNSILIKKITRTNTRHFHRALHAQTAKKIQFNQKSALKICYNAPYLS